MPVWRLDLTNADPSAEQWALERQARQVAAVEDGLDQASDRLKRVLGIHRNRGGSGVSFSALQLPTAESNLLFALDVVEHAPDRPVAAGTLDYGVRDLASAVGLPWGKLEQKFNLLLDSLEYQFLNLAWVDTTLDDQLVARTVVSRSGDLKTCLRPDLSAARAAAHWQSLTHALASRRASLRTVLTMAQVAGKIVYAVTTPLGATQALAWQFIRQVVMPLVNEVQNHTNL